MAFSNSELTFVKKGEDPAAAIRVHRHIAWDLSDAAIAKTGIIAAPRVQGDRRGHDQGRQLPALARRLLPRPQATSSTT